MSNCPLPLYFDYAATTPLDPLVLADMTRCLQDGQSYGNASSASHLYGDQAYKLIEHAKNDIATVFNAIKHDIIFTSGATESINLALKGVSSAYQHIGKHIITVKTEHKATLDTCKSLEEHGFSITYLPVLASGLLDLKVLENAIQEDTILVSIMHVNNEIGTIQDIAKIATIVHQHQAFFHVDAAQSAGKLPIDLSCLDIDLLSATAHKIYGPKGAGLLIKKATLKLKSQIHGGSQQYQLRAGTLPTHQIVGLASALLHANHLQLSEYKRLERFRTKLWENVTTLGGITINGDPNHAFFGIMNICVEGIDGEALLMGLHNIALSQGSACSSATQTPSPVLKSLGLSDEKCHQSIRLSFGRFSTDDDINSAIQIIKSNVTKLRKLSPLWNLKHEDNHVKC